MIFVVLAPMLIHLALYIAMNYLNNPLFRPGLSTKLLNKCDASMLATFTVAAHSERNLHCGVVCDNVLSSSLPSTRLACCLPGRPRPFGYFHDSIKTTCTIPHLASSVTSACGDSPEALAIRFSISALMSASAVPKRLTNTSWCSKCSLRRFDRPSYASRICFGGFVTRRRSSFNAGVGESGGE